MSIYQVIAEWVLMNPELHSSHVLSQIVLSLFNQSDKVNLGEAFSILDQEHSGWALEAMRCYAEEGETPELKLAALMLLERQRNETL